MKTESRRLLPAALCLVLAACTTPPAQVSPGHVPPTRTIAVEDAPLRAMLAYYASNPRLSVEAMRERPATSDPYLLMQQAIQLGNARPPELQRASNLLEMVMKSSHPSAADLAPLARLLHEQYGERLRLEQQWREAQRRGDQLQEKIDALSAIERNLPTRPRPRSRTLPEGP